MATETGGLRASFNSEVDQNFNDKSFGVGAYLRNEFNNDFQALGDYSSQPTRYRILVDDIINAENTKQNLAPLARELWIKNLFMNHVIDRPENRVDIDQYGDGTRLVNGIKIQYSFDGETIIDLFDFPTIKDYGELFIQNMQFRNREFGRSGSAVFGSQIIFDAILDTGTYLKFEFGKGGFMQVIINDNMTNRKFIHHNFRVRGMVVIA